MEEKERYKLESYNEAFCQIHDTESDEWYLRKDLVKDLLNEQDQKIKDLKAKLEEYQNDRVEDVNLKNELSELKQKAIVPKFYAGQDIFFIDNECQITQGVVDIILTGQDVFEKWCKYSIDLGLEYEDDIRFVDKDEEEIFATKEEAEQKLTEIGGKK